MLLGFRAINELCRAIRKNQPRGCVAWLRGLVTALLEDGLDGASQSPFHLTVLGTHPGHHK